MATLGLRVGSSRPRVAPSGRRATSSRAMRRHTLRIALSARSSPPRSSLRLTSPHANRQRRVSLRSSARPLASPRPAVRSVFFVGSCASRPTVTPLSASSRIFRTAFPRSIKCSSCKHAHALRKERVTGAESREVVRGGTRRPRKRMDKQAKSCTGADLIDRLLYRLRDT